MTACCRCQHPVPLQASRSRWQLFHNDKHAASSLQTLQEAACLSCGLQPAVCVTVTVLTPASRSLCQVKPSLLSRVRKLTGASSCCSVRLCQSGVLREHDVLPPNLQQLRAPDLCSPLPLLPLHKLEELTLDYATADSMTAAGLCRLSSLTALTAVHLVYEVMAGANAASGGWGALPVASLTMGVDWPDALLQTSLQYMAQLNRLQELTICCCHIHGTMQVGSS